MAYGHNGNFAEADLASAQAAFARGDNKTARELAARAKTRFPIGSPGWVRADDIVAFNKGKKPPSVRSIIAKDNDNDIERTHGISDRGRTVSGGSGGGDGANVSPPISARKSAPSSKNICMAHPEVMQDVMAELEKHQQAAEAEKHRAAVAQNNATLFSSPHQVVLGNPHGNVTMVEFFDYNCGYCKRAMSDMLDLLKTNPNLKFVLKEFPVLGEGSVEAAHVAVAARMQDATGKKYIEFHQKLLGGRGAADKARALAVAKDVGFDMARIEKDMGSDEVKKTIDESMKLAEALGVNGTPSYVVGDEVVVGAVGLDALKEKLAAERK